MIYLNSNILVSPSPIIMMSWGQLNFQEGIRTTIEFLNYFHDYIIVILLLIITFVTYIFLYVSVSPYMDKYTIDSHVLDELDSAPLYYTLDVDNRLVLPTMANILFLITSADVLHSWTVPTLGIKVDAMPGRLNYLTSKSMFSGVYYGQCSEICGSNHSFIPIVLEFVPIASYLSYISTL